MVTANSRKTVVKVKKSYVIGAFQAILQSRKGFNKKFKNIIFSLSYFLMKKTYIQYEWGFSNPKGWINYDSSPTLRIQKTFIIGRLIKGLLNVWFPENIIFGDIVSGLKVKENKPFSIYIYYRPASSKVVLQELD